jgi:hypothetical protein
MRLPRQFLDARVGQYLDERVGDVEIPRTFGPDLKKRGALELAVSLGVEIISV